MSVIEISTKGNFLEKSKSLKYIHKLPQMCRNAMREWGKMELAPAMRRAAKQANIKNFKGKLSGPNGIKWNQDSDKSNYGYLTIVDEGVILDSMPAHKWTIGRNRAKGINWLLQSENFSSQGMDLKKGRLATVEIWVKPHPFIRTGYNTARKKLPAILKGYTRKTGI